MRNCTLQTHHFGHKIEQKAKQWSQLTMSSLMLVCTECKKKFKDRRGLTQHQRKQTTCRSQNALNVNAILANNDVPSPPDLLAFSRVNLTKHRQALAKNPPLQANLPSRQPQIDKTSGAKTTGQKSSLETMNKNDDDLDVDLAPPVFDDKDTGAPEELAVMSQSGGVSDLSDVNWIRNDWIECVKCALNFPPFTQHQLKAVRLLSILRNSKACLGTCDKAMNWHFWANGDVHMHEMASRRHFFSRNDLCQFLKEQHDSDTGCGIIKKLVLPSRKSRVRMVTNDTAKSCKVCLLALRMRAKTTGACLIRLQSWEIVVCFYPTIFEIVA